MSNAQDTLQAWPSNLGIFEPYCRHETPLILKLREKRLSLTGDSFEITTVDGQGFLKANPSLVSFVGKKVLVDPASGNPVLTITQKPLSLHKEFRIFAGDSDSEQLVTVRGKFKLFGSPEMMVHFRNRSDGKEMELHIKGEFFRRNATISCEGRTIATIKNKILNSGELFFDQQTYFLTVAPRVDSAMIAAICICLDERREK
ncbi:uncharacterized protein LAJ45_05785 [Morchella importuna]|uniref:uncharacterized protein n=1 Tax=Morchella importuna TaxID=1174673 RepID=UPI001E8EC4A6|nr:uncharacterized protein LAJ45_05785 [Morchella importuna]KAH8150099.1 hypothetical protein LAJ45_05785 [Morchella importuna]